MNRRLWIYLMVASCSLLLVGCLGPLLQVDIYSPDAQTVPDGAADDADAQSVDQPGGDLDVSGPADADALVSTSKIQCPQGVAAQFPQNLYHHVRLTYAGVDVSSIELSVGAGATNVTGSVVVDAARGKTYLYINGLFKFAVDESVGVTLKNGAGQTIDATTCTLSVVTQLSPQVFCPALPIPVQPLKSVFPWTHTTCKDFSEFYVGIVGDPSHDFSLSITSENGNGVVTTPTASCVAGSGGLVFPHRIIGDSMLAPGVARFQGSCSASGTMSVTFKLVDQTTKAEDTRTCIYTCPGTPCGGTCCTVEGYSNKSLSAAYCSFVKTAASLAPPVADATNCISAQGCDDPDASGADTQQADTQQADTNGAD